MHYNVIQNYETVEVEVKRNVNKLSMYDQITQIISLI